MNKRKLDHENCEINCRAICKGFITQIGHEKQEKSRHNPSKECFRRKIKWILFGILEVTDES